MGETLIQSAEEGSLILVMHEQTRQKQQLKTYNIKETELPYITMNYKLYEISMFDMASKSQWAII